MKNKDQALKWKLCKTYFSILNATNKNSINLKDLCLKSKISYDEAKKISQDVEELDWVGYNIKTNKTVNLKDAGIIDPFKVTRSALQNASSIAGTILLTEATIIDKPTENSQPQMDPSMMGMM